MKYCDAMGLCEVGCDDGMVRSDVGNVWQGEVE